ncbi:hypothetical protein E4T50_07599 [Aureobasidium sp. EXF-12298]|nr:hypothetical protein E4T50_07599 [Aureobasidium sp. EXF-12298]KAI4759841.1 hypothetical protein E4T51_07144 [Aureobasidium sp. EXF-12344]KAI4772115.1 hypothetical protein E4T52_12902 [Aureobasidium sp. EXF-3400]
MRFFIFAAIFWTWSGSVLASSELCDSFETKRYLTAQEVKDELGPWFRTQFDEWKSEHAAAEPRFWSWFHQKYSPVTTDSILSCKLSGTCNPVACSHISDKYSLDVQRNALFAMESVVNFHNTMWMIKEANAEAFNNVEAEMQSLLNQFSDGKNVDHQKAKHRENMNVLMHSIIAVTVLSTALFTGLGSLLSLGTAVAALAGAVGESVNSLTTATANLVAGVARIEASISGSMSAIGSTTVQLSNDMLDAPDYAEKIYTAAREAMSQNQHLTTKLFDANMLVLLGGKVGVSKDYTLVDIVQGGQYVNTTEILPSYRDELRYMWTASAISTIWSMEHSYIVASDVSSGSCKSDHRGPQILKSCLSEYPTKVFYTYFLSRCREGSSGKPLVRGPPGHELLKKMTNFTLDDVVRSSMTHLKDHGNKIPRPAMGVDGLTTMFAPKNAIMHGGGRARGLFNIPVCYTPGGQAISSINLKKSRNMPCACSKFSFSGKHHMAAEMDHAEMQAQALQKRDDGGRWKNDFDTAYNFFLSSGIGTSEKFRSYCTHNREHGNSCHKKDHEHWSWPQGTNGPKHPFHKCKANSHEHVGCQKPHNDGHHQNKHCAGHTVGLDALAMDNSDEAGGMNATWRNSTAVSDYDADDDSDNEYDDAADSEDVDDSDGESGDEDEPQADEHQ